MKQLYIWLSLFVGSIFLVSCGAPAPTPTPYVPAAEIPFAVATGTVTPISPRLKNLRFSTSGNADLAQPSGTIFDAGQPAMYAIVDYANWPADTLVKVEVTRNDVESPLSTQPWTSHITGTGVLTIPLITDSHQLIPELYLATIQAGEETLEGIFRISSVDGKPGTVLITETFENNAHGLAQWKEADSSASITDDHFRLTTPITSFVTSVDLPSTLVDFDATFEVQRDPTSPDAIVGLVFRDDERGAYAFEVTNDGTWSFGTNMPSFSTPFRVTKNPGAIRSGAAVNLFRVVGQGNQFVFYANGVKLGEVIDHKSKFTYGRIGLGVRSPTGKPVTAWFDKVSVALPETLSADQPTSPASPVTILAKQFREAVLAVYQMDALLNESRLDLSASACAEIMPRFYKATSILPPDVANQPFDVRYAVRFYTDAAQMLKQAIPEVQRICEAGGGVLKQSNFDQLRAAVRWADVVFWRDYLAVK